MHTTTLVNNREIVAVFEKGPNKVKEAKNRLGNDLAAYDDFDKFIAHEGLEAVFLCNYFHEHAKYAIKCLDSSDLQAIKSLRPYADHWRNTIPRTYYITHSLAPLMYITGSIPKIVTAMPVYAPFPRHAGFRVGDRAAIIT